MDVLHIVLSFIVGAVAGFFGATVGGGGMLAIPYLMFIGLPPQIAIASARFGDMGFAMTSIRKFWKSNQIVWEYVPMLAVISLAGSLIGANILLTIEPEYLQKVAAILLFLLLPFVVFKKEMGVVRREVSKRSELISACVYFLIQTVTGFFAAGTGPLVYYTLMAGFGLTIVEAVATQMIPFLVLAVSSVIIFAMHGLIDYPTGFVLLLGSAIGGYIGAHVAIRKGARWIKGLFAVMVLAAGLKLLFF